MITNVVSDLVGEIVEIYEWQNRYGDGADRHEPSRAESGYSLRARGTARAIYVTAQALMVLVEHNLGWDSQAYTDRAKDGGFEVYSFHEGRVRAVQRCQRCAAWDQKSMLVAVYPGEGTEKAWEHKNGEGCKRVGHGG